jgi:hypothetical protein
LVFSWSLCLFCAKEMAPSASACSVVFFMPYRGSFMLFWALQLIGDTVFSIRFFIWYEWSFDTPNLHLWLDTEPIPPFAFRATIVCLAHRDGVLFPE